MGNSTSRFSKLGGRRTSRVTVIVPPDTPVTVPTQPSTPNASSANMNIPGRPSAGRSPRWSTESISSFSPGGDEVPLIDTDLADFDDGMKLRAEKVLGSIEQGLTSGGLELSSLRDVTSGLLDMDQDVVKFLLDSNVSLWANDEMKELVTQYFDHSLRALDFCGALKKSVQRARDNQMLIESAIRYMPQDRDPNEEECRRILSELDLFTQAENPFISPEFTMVLTDIYNDQKQFEMKLRERTKRMQRKDRNVRAVKKVANAMLTATCVSLVIFAAVAMAVASPLTNRSASEAASLPFDSMHGWLRSLWSDYEQKVKIEKAVLDAAQWSTWVAITDLDTIRTEVKRLNGGIDGIIRNVQFGKVRGDSLAVRQSVKAIRKNLDQLIGELEDLNSHVLDCARRISKTRDAVLTRIMNNS